MLLSTSVTSFSFFFVRKYLIPMSATYTSTYVIFAYMRPNKCILKDEAVKINQ